ncbi:toxin-antitoxin system HicB family antitoxin [Rhodococcus rhodnii]|nr:toxin-antitoxin system HicB family antitoxin [Rhodococcus rhodnii]TXG92646.1 toxin-antitoxin system HicB family antitoxin [Rhodococcus rhodnii]
MNIDDHVARLRNDLVSAAALGDERTQQIAAALAEAIVPAARMTILSVATELASEIDDRLPDRSVGVRLDGDRIVAEVRSSDAPPTDPVDVSAAFDNMSGEISRVSLRLMEQLKSRAEEAASQNGVSLNSWLSQAVQGALRDQMRRSTQRPGGFPGDVRRTESERTESPGDGGTSEPGRTADDTDRRDDGGA